jgi:hypothetical protein
VQIHRRRDPDFLTQLHTHGFRVLTIARHPCDVLISILQFAIHESESERWLQGQGGGESCLFGAMPRSRAFVEYAVSDRARQLFAVTGDWWTHPGAVTVRYEDLVRDPAGELGRLVAEFRRASRTDLPELVARHDLEQLQKTSFNSHFWKGMPGLWRHFLTADVTREIAPALAGPLGQLGYTCDADPELTDSAADRNWVSATGPTLRAALRRAASSHVFERTVQRAALDRLAGELSAARSEAERANLETERANLETERAKHEADRANREAERATLEATEMRARMAPFEGLDGFSIRVARAVQAICDRVALWSRFRRPNQPR